MKCYDRIPKELQNLPNWVCARRDSKVPMNATKREAASSASPVSWSTFEQATEAVNVGRYDDIGFVFAGNGYVGIDIDAGFDEDGFISKLACDIIGLCQSYTEKSRSGRGFHIILRGDLPFNGKNNLNGVEIYKTARYFIMTGDVLFCDTIREGQEAIDTVIRTYFPEQMRDTSKGFAAPRVYAPKWCKVEGGRVPLRPNYPIITSGGRNISLTSLAGSLHTTGYTPDEIYAELIRCNTEACRPLLDDEEIRSIVQSITRYIR